VYDAAYVPSPSSDHHHPSPLLSVMRARARHAVSIRRFSFSSVPIQKYEIFTKRARSRQGATGKPVLASCELAERQRGGGGGRGKASIPLERSRTRQRASLALTPMSVDLHSREGNVSRAVSPHRPFIPADRTRKRGNQRGREREPAVRCTRLNSEMAHHAGRSFPLYS